MSIVDCSNPNLERVRQQFQVVLAAARDSAPQEIRIGIQSKSTLPSDDARHLLLQFNSLFENEYTPRDGAWEHIYGVLALLRQTIAETIGRRALLIEPYAHHTIAFMLGNLFDEPSGYSLSIMQRNEIWNAQIAPDETFAVDVQVMPVFALARDIALELAVTLDVEKQVTQTIPQLKRPIRQRIQMRARDYECGEYWLNAGQAMQFARQIRRVLKQQRSDVNYEQVHIFGTVPFGLACWIGRWSNAVGPLQLYEFNNATHVYTPSFQIA